MKNGGGWSMKNGGGWGRNSGGRWLGFVEVKVVGVESLEVDGFGV